MSLLGPPSFSLYADILSSLESPCNSQLSSLQLPYQTIIEELFQKNFLKHSTVRLNSSIGASSSNLSKLHLPKLCIEQSQKYLYLYSYIVVSNKQSMFCFLLGLLYLLNFIWYRIS